MWLMEKRGSHFRTRWVLVGGCCSVGPPGAKHPNQEILNIKKSAQNQKYPFVEK
jgi:hypothetical protein